MSINPETAVSYAALILADEGMKVTSDKLQTLLAAAGVNVDPIWSNIFAKALEDKDIKQILTSVQTSSPPNSGTPGKAQKAPEPVPDQIVGDDDGSESGSDIGLGLFDV